MAVRARYAAEATAESGYRRVVPFEDPCAVVWWYVRREPGGYVFARGGRCRTSKLARTLIHRAAVQARQEIQEVPRVIAVYERRGATPQREGGTR